MLLVVASSRKAASLQGMKWDGEQRAAEGPWYSRGASEKVSLSASGVPLHWQCKDGTGPRSVRGASNSFFPLVRQGYFGRCYHGYFSSLGFVT